jgi:hypothetical protein
MVFDPGNIEASAFRDKVVLRRHLGVMAGREAAKSSPAPEQPHPRPLSSEENGWEKYGCGRRAGLTPRYRSAGEPGRLFITPLLKRFATPFMADRAKTA